MLIQSSEYKKRINKSSTIGLVKHLAALLLRIARSLKNNSLCKCGKVARS